MGVEVVVAIGRALLVIELLVFSSCVREASVDPLLPDSMPVIEESALYNEAYRDSILIQTFQGILIAYKNGTGLRWLDSVDTRFVSWSPNKWKIIYSTPYDLYVAECDGRGRRRISRERDYIKFAMCSPDRHRIAYIATDSSLTSGWIKLMDADGSNVQILTPLQPIPNRVVWTPDSRHVIFNGADSISRGIFMVSVDGKSTDCLFRDIIGLCSFPSLSRNGGTLAFTASTGPGVGGKLFLLDMVTKQIRQLTTGNSLDSEASWSEDGTMLVYSRSESTGPYSWVGSSVWTIDRNGQQTARITPGESHDYYGPCWQQ
jgi:Tol biopolymer transport system component